MLQFEKYENHLIPVDYVLHVSVESAYDEDTYRKVVVIKEPKTVIYICGPYGSTSIELNGDQLDKFHKWISQFRNANDIGNAVLSQWQKPEWDDDKFLKPFYSSNVETSNKDDSSTVTIQNLDSENQP